MTPDVLLPYLVGPFGALVALSILAFVLWRELQSEKKRVDRLDGVTEGALANTAAMLQRTEAVLANHERIFALLEAIRAEQAHAKDREDWRR